MKLVYPQIITGADLLNGIIKLDRLAPLLQRRGAVSAAIVNSTLSGIRSFWKVMTKYGIHPVIGLSMKIELSTGETPLCYVYAENEMGFRQLLKMSSAAATRDTGNLPEKWLKSYTANCAVIFPLTDPSWNEIRTEEMIQRLKKHCATENLYIGIARPAGAVHPEESTMEHLAEMEDLPIVACNEARYIEPKDAFSFETAQAIREGYKLNDPARPANLYTDAYVPEQQELEQWFADKQHWLEKAAEVLLACNVRLPEKQLLMPKFPVGKNCSAAQLLEDHCRAGLQKRLSEISSAYEERLRYELDVIVEMGYQDYFLIVEDFIAYAKQKDIEVGPGRGSSAGSLVAFSLGITAVDPLKYGLIFERFLNKSRVTMPDIDVDFADTRRMEVVEYVARKYGKAHVAQIITFGTLSAKSVARNTSRVFGFSNEDMTFLSKALSDAPGKTLHEKVSQSSQLQTWIEKEEVRTRWFEASLALEGLPRNASTHAAGVILSPTPLVETVPLQSGGDSIYLTQWAMNDSEEAGLLKMDFLGLRNLTLLDRIRKMICFETGEDLSLDTIPLHDERTMELFRKGDMSGIFQFESPGMRKALREISPDVFEDIYAITALYRPGPMENIPLYSRRKKGLEPIHYMHPALEPILKETYGIIVYQEQILQIAVQIAGFTLGEADLLRRAISKKKRDVLMQERIHFTDSSKRNGFPASIAGDIYDLIVKFADYGFPKSHAVAYSLISYQLAYLKANKPEYFYAGCLSVLAGSLEKTMEFMREVKGKGIPVLGPSITKSNWSATTEKGSIRLGLSAVKGISYPFYTTLKRARQKEVKLQTLFDLSVALGAENFTEKTIPPLIKSGALDEFGQTREVLLATIEAARKHALFVRPSSDDTDLLAGMMKGMASPKYSPGGTMSDMQRLDYEKETLGFYLSEHPIASFKKKLTLESNSIADALEKSSGAKVVLAGMVLEVKRIRTKKGEAMAFLELQDETGEISCTLFPKQYAAYSTELNEQSLVVFHGTVEVRNGRPQLVVQEILAV
ncbi:DNA polymerase III subunit alpha [Sporosarcina gallistercoris]|uniref:DNA-directed DNA polymerase n=1 Tax=Sporosarcina gallistercoris TaxID=2762245 RepID=A0ABR8PIE2_9BACL|nr:DNA polymerase III subunit alpha [Sporosarcina gallistercoris]MBD7907935.1 DNA polymerase III subunit alpha [Sporosarcina gallistercoris]